MLIFLTGQNLSALLFNPARQRAFFARAYAKPPAEEFLFKLLAGELLDRLSLVLRDFKAIVDLGTPSPLPSQVLARTLRGAHLTMLAPVKEIAAHMAPNIVRLIGTPESLPFAAASFDAALSCLALHNLNDVPRALVEARRVLKPDGLFLGALLGRASLQELRESLIAAEALLARGASPRVAPFPEASAVGSLLQRAGFALPVVDVETLLLRYSSLPALIADLRAHGAGNALLGASPKPAPRTLLATANAFYQQNFSASDGRLIATVEIIWFSAFVPHESQQKPLPRGSAKMGLGQVLEEIAKKRQER